MNTIMYLLKQPVAIYTKVILRYLRMQQKQSESNALRFHASKYMSTELLPSCIYFALPWVIS